MIKKRSMPPNIHVLQPSSTSSTLPLLVTLGENSHFSPLIDTGNLLPNHKSLVNGFNDVGYEVINPQSACIENMRCVSPRNGANKTCDADAGALCLGRVSRTITQVFVQADRYEM
jgi:hypothetical protein